MVARKHLLSQVLLGAAQLYHFLKEFRLLLNVFRCELIVDQLVQAS